MFTGSTLKWAIGAGIAILMILGAYKLYNLGYDAAMAKVTSDNNIAINAAVEAARIEWKSSQSITQKGINDVQETKQKIIYITQKADQIQAPECTNLGSDYVGVYNEYIDAIQGHANSGGSISVGKVPGETVDANANTNP